MMQMTIMTLLLTNVILFTQMNHPLSMGLILLIQTILTCAKSGLDSNNFWFSYILFLIFIGGMLILFIYMSSLSSNEKLKFNTKIFKKFCILFMFISIILISVDKFLMNLSSKNLEMNFYNELNTLMKENLLNLSKMYEMPNNFMTLMMILYLLLTLIVTVKITDSFMGPLRTKN